LHVQSLDLKVWEIKARDKKQDGGTFYKNRLNLLFAPIQRYCRRRISQGAAPLARILATKARDEYSTQPPNEQCIALAAKCAPIQVRKNKKPPKPLLCLGLSGLVFSMKQCSGAKGGTREPA
jgi:hypothetical protein